MKTFTKKLFVLFTAVLLALGLCAFAACGEKEDDKGGSNGDTYTVTVTVYNPDGSLNTTAGVQICEIGDNGELERCLEPVKVNAQGVATIETPSMKPVEVHLMYITGYKFNAIVLDKDNTTGSITLREDDGKETYTVTVVVPQDSGLDLTTLSVKLTGENDTYTEALSADGVASFYIPVGSYMCQLASTPDGYFANIAELTATTHTATITLTASAS